MPHDIREERFESRERAFNDYKWVNSQEVKQYECIIGIDKEVEATIALFKEA